MGSWRIGSIFGIPLRLHYTWLIIFILISFSLFQLIPGAAAYPLWERVAFALIASALFFSSIILHELLHSIVAVKNGIPVKDITLFVFGGVSRITKEASRPGIELLMAIMGPVTSLILGGIFFGLMFLLGGPNTIAGFFAYWLGYINILLGIFNLIPGFPLDGGRVLRSIIWMINRNYAKATNIAALVGQTFGYLFIAGGIVVLFTVNLFQGLWIALIGWFLQTAAASSRQQLLLRESLRGYKARDVMTPGCDSVPPNLSVGQLVNEHILPTGRRCAMVQTDGKVEGIVTLSNIKSAPRETWDLTPVRNVMTPTERLKSVRADEDAYRLLEVMDENDLAQVPVMDEGQVVGMVARENVIRFIRTRAELSS